MINKQNDIFYADAGAVIHTHSKAAVMATLLYPGTEFKITHQEMIKGIKKCKSGKSNNFHFVCMHIDNTNPCFFFIN